MKTKRVRPVLCDKFNVSAIFKRDKTGVLIYDKPDYSGICMFYDIFLISLDDDDKIEVGELYVKYKNEHNTSGKFISDNYNTCTANRNFIENYYNNYGRYHYKIIATQTQISPSHICKLIEDYNNGGMMDFEIEWLEDYGHIDKDYDENDHGNAIKIKNEPILNSEGFIIIIDK